MSLLLSEAKPAAGLLVISILMVEGRSGGPAAGVYSTIHTHKVIPYMEEGREEDHGQVWIAFKVGIGPPPPPHLHWLVIYTQPHKWGRGEEVQLPLRTPSVVVLVEDPMMKTPLGRLFCRLLLTDDKVESEDEEAAADVGAEAAPAPFPSLSPPPLAQSPRDGSLLLYPFTRESTKDPKY